MKYLSIIAVAMMTVMGAMSASAQVNNRQTVQVTDAVKVANVMSIGHKPGCNKGIPYADSEGNFTGGKVYNHSGPYVGIGGGMAFDNGHSDVHGSTSSTRGLVEALAGFEYHKEGWFASPFAEVYGGGLIGSGFSAMGGARFGAFFNPCGKVRPGLAADVRYQNQKDQTGEMKFRSNKLILGVRGYLDIQMGSLKTTKWSDGYPVEQYRPVTARLFCGVMFDQLEQPHDEAVGPKLRKWNNTRIEVGVQFCFRSL